MQCFQKDPNLRVSARKLLKHPWIINAKRSDAVVPKKPTQYDEAVKSVQQWNEALKSPNAGSLRKAPRPLSSSPIPGRRDPARAIVTPAKGVGKLKNSKVDTEQFRSPSTAEDDNWDDDFDSAISPTALQLPHLKPRDNFGGLLSSEKLKAFASFETVSEEANWDDSFDDDATVKSPMRPTNPDPLKTIRLVQTIAKETRTDQPVTQRLSGSKALKSGSRKISNSTLPAKSAPHAIKPSWPSTNSFVENDEEDYSDLIVDDPIFQFKLGVKRVWQCTCAP